MDIRTEKGNVLFIVYPTYSHYVSMVPLAEKYKARGFQVFFTGKPGYKSAIEKWGFKYRELDYLDSYPVRNLKTALQIIAASYLSGRFVRLRYRKFLKLDNTLSCLMQELSPEKIYLDSHLTFYLIHFLAYKNRLVFFNTKLTTARNPYIPPLNSGYVASQNLIAKLYAWLLWKMIYCKNLAISMLTSVIFYGRDDHYFICKHLENQNLSFEQLFEPRFKSLFHIEANKQFSDSEFNSRFPALEYPFLSSSPKQETEALPPYLHIEEEGLFPNLYDFINKFKAHRSATGKGYLIYCALGTMTMRYEKKCSAFLQKVLDVFSKEPDYWLIISTGGIPRSAFKQNGQVFMRERLPQHNILQLCDLMITHGGLNSVAECTYFKVPMLVYPVNKHFDQPGNSARVVYHQLGLSGKLNESGLLILEKAKAAIAAGSRKFMYGKRCKQV